VTAQTFVGVEAELRACFDVYEDALVANDVPAMNAWFVDDPRTARFGVADEQWGSDAIRRWRATAPAVPAGRTLSTTDVVVWAPDLAVVTTLFRYPSSAQLGRQSQTWLRTEAGWRIVHAHVSQRDEPTG
jgi:hypothetical protein